MSSQKTLTNNCATCGKKFGNTREMGVNMCESCEHLVHNTPECKNGKCCVCDSEVEKYLSLSDLDESDQRYIDILSVTRIKNKYSCWRWFIAILRIIWMLPTILGLLLRTSWDSYFNTTFTSKIYLIGVRNALLRTLNVNINVEGTQNLRDPTKCVLIANHTSYLDMLVISTVSTDMGFIASYVIKQNIFGKAIAKVFPCVIVEKNSTGNFDKVTKFLENYNKIGFCPEGTLCHDKCMLRFRSSAFKYGFPIRPIIVNYKQTMYDLSDFDLFLNERVEVNIKILDLIDTDGSQQSITEIREKMAREGGLKLSRVINK